MSFKQENHHTPEPVISETGDQSEVEIASYDPTIDDIPKNVMRSDHKQERTTSVNQEENDHDSEPTTPVNQLVEMEYNSNSEEEDHLSEQQQDTRSNDLRSWKLTQHKNKRKGAGEHCTRFGWSNCVACALNVAQYIDNYEPRNYQEAISCSESNKWI